MSGGFPRSSTFGIVGVIVVMVACAAIALQFGSGTAHPTGALIAIVAIVFGFISVLMVLQRRDLNEASGAAEREALADVAPVSDPTAVPPGSLIAAMAVRPVDERALSGTAAAWGGRARLDELRGGDGDPDLLRDGALDHLPVEVV